MDDVVVFVSTCRHKGMLCCFHPSDAPSLLRVAQGLPEPDVWYCCRCPQEVKAEPGREREEKSHGMDGLETPDAFALRRMLTKRARELTAAELFTLAALRTQQLDHPKNDAGVRRVGRAVGDGLYQLVRALAVPALRKAGELVIVEKPPLKVLGGGEGGS